MSAHNIRESNVIRPWRGWLRAIGTQLGRLILLLLLIVVAAVGIAASVIAAQGQRDETRSVDMLLVIAPNPSPAAIVEHSFDLYRRGYAPQITVAGPGRQQAHADLLARGVPADAFATVAAGESLGDALAAARASGARSLLVVCAPADQLLSLKVAHDQRLRAYGSPIRSGAPDLLALLRSALGYWRYALLGDA